jgi:hypothetical protein
MTGEKLAFRRTCMANRNQQRNFEQHTATTENKGKSFGVKSWRSFHVSYPAK